MSLHPAFEVSVSTPRLELLAATDELLAELAPLVRAGQAMAKPSPFDDPMSLYEPDPDVRAQRWLQSIWRGRGSLGPDSWRLYFVVMVDGAPVGMQDLIGDHFPTYGGVVTFSWLAASVRGRGLGREMREAVLHLAFDGLGAVEAESDAFVDNLGSNGVSRALGYEPNGTAWATRRGEKVLLQRWRLGRDAWLRRDDITLGGVDQCRHLLGIEN